MKSLLITTAFLTAPIATVSAQSVDILKSQVAEQNRQIITLEKEVRSLQSLLELERSRKGKVQTKTKFSAEASSVSGKTHKVISGETFTSIARKHKVSLASLISANKNKNPNKISIGDKLSIPGKPLTISQKPRRNTKTDTISTSTSGSSSYKVVKGDTFYSIARKNGITTSRIKALNPGIKPTKLQVGQVIKMRGSVSRTASASIEKDKKRTGAKASSTTRRPQQTKPISKQEVAVLPEVTAQTISNPSSRQVAKTVKVEHVMTYGAFAAQHGTSINVLNKLNGLDLPANEPMAVGSALYVPN